MGNKKKAPNNFFSFLDVNLENIPLDGEDTGDVIPVEMLRTGNFIHQIYGNLEINKELMDKIKENFDNKVIGRDISFDFNHKRQEATAWLEALEVEDAEDGTDFNKLVGYVSFTDIGREAVTSKRYQYFSSEFSENWVDPEGKEHGPTLLGGALTNRPFITKLRKIEFEESDDKSKLYKFMEEKSMGKTDGDKTIVREPVIVDNSDDNSVNGGVNDGVQFKEAVSFVADLKAALGADDISNVKEFFASIKKNQKDFSDQIVALQEENKSLKEKNETTEHKARVTDIERKCDKLLSDGHHPSVVEVAKSIMLSDIGASGVISFEDNVGTGDEKKTVKVELNVAEAIERLLEAIPSQQRATYKQETISGAYEKAISDEEKVASLEEGRKRALAKRGLLKK